MVLSGVRFLEFGMHLKAYYSRAWGTKCISMPIRGHGGTECILRPTIRGLGGHRMHLKAYYSRVWSTECILRPTIRGFGLGIHLKAHYARLGGPAKASTFKVAKTKNPDIGPRGWDFQISPFGRRGTANGGGGAFTGRRRQPTPLEPGPFQPHPGSPSPSRFPLR